MRVDSAIAAFTASVEYPAVATASLFAKTAFALYVF
nr:MAG TPA: hypothetical protein [Bacteriophage sp.]